MNIYLYPQESRHIQTLNFAGGSWTEIKTLGTVGRANAIFVFFKNLDLRWGFGLCFSKKAGFILFVFSNPRRKRGVQPGVRRESRE